MQNLIRLPIGENVNIDKPIYIYLYKLIIIKLMASILAGLEFISETSTFIGFTSQKLVIECRVLATIYGQWVSENLEHINDRSTEKKNQNVSKRIDIRFMQLMENITRILSCLYTSSELEIRQSSELSLSSRISIENLTSVLVELTVRAVGVIEMERKNSTSGKIAGNIMSNPQTAFIYMGESLLTFANKLIELAGREYIDGGRITVNILFFHLLLMRARLICTLY